jgi:tocopherol cyclase
MSLRVYTPFVFQGNLKKHHYFEGWYFKHVSGDQQNTWSFIPGVSLNRNDPHAFIQIIDGIKGVTEYVRYPISDFNFDKKSASLRIGKSFFSENSISLNIENERTIINGEIQYHNSVKYPKSFIYPGIMGWYSFIPFMECNHGIISVNHTLSGILSVNGTLLNFDNGKGYIEKDWGTSFPEAWIWMQSNNFSTANTSFSFSIAKIPWLGKFFIGFISFLYYNNKFYLFSTYNKSAFTNITHSGNTIDFEISNRDFIIKVIARHSTFGELRAPISGDMSRRIKESVDSVITISLFDKQNNLIYNDTGKRAGLEVIDKIFEYLNY